MTPQKIIDNYKKAKADLQNLAEAVRVEYQVAYGQSYGYGWYETEEATFDDFIGLWGDTLLYFDPGGVEFEGMAFLPVDALLDIDKAIADIKAEVNNREQRHLQSEATRLRDALAEVENKLSQENTN